MKIILEFDSKSEHDFYWKMIKEQTKEENVDLSVSEFKGEPVDILKPGKKKHFSEMEFQFVKDYYQTKTVRWIARQLGRKPQSVSMVLYRMYKQGLPRKHNRSKLEKIINNE